MLCALIAQCAPEYKRLPSLREQALIQDGWRAERIARVPSLLNEYGVDAWLICQREHAEDTIWRALKNGTDFDSHRRSLILFHTNALPLPNPLMWIDNTGQVWPELRQTLEEYDPYKIALNTDSYLVFGGGLHVGEINALSEQLGPKWMNRTVNVPMLGVEFAGRQLKTQLPYYRDLQETVWAMMAEGFSHAVIEPGVTTTTDVEWWFRDKIQAHNLTTWCHARVSVLTPESFPGWEGSGDVILEGDLLHIDWGVSGVGLNTDTQHMAYVLRPGETDAPQGLKDGLKKVNHLQDIALEEMVPGLTGNQVLANCLARMKVEGIEGQIYSHAIGAWGHGAGTVIGFTNLPEHVPVFGDQPVFNDSYYSIELYAYHFVPERNETIRFRLEEDAFWNETTQSWKFVYGRQESLYLIDSSKRPSSAPYINVISFTEQNA